MSCIIAIDGLSATGKTTISQWLAKKLNFDYICSGNLYRVITYLLIKNNFPISETIKIDTLLRRSKFDFVNSTGVKINDDYLENELRDDLIEKKVQLVAQIQIIRDFINELIRSVASSKNCIVEGRDIGTVVFPNADVKFFFMRDFSQKKISEKLEEGSLTIKEYQRLSKRDIIDINRNISPLRKSKKALMIYTFEYTLEELYILVEEYARTMLDEKKNE